MKRQCVLCGRIPYGGAKIKKIKGKEVYICQQCVDKGRKRLIK